MARGAAARAEVGVTIVTTFAACVAVGALLQNNFLQEVLFRVDAAAFAVLLFVAGDRVVHDARDVVAARDATVLLEQRVGDLVQAQRDAGGEVASRGFARTRVDRAFDA